jgi:hypothetical protein
MTGLQVLTEVYELLTESWQQPLSGETIVVLRDFRKKLDKLSDDLIGEIHGNEKDE